MKYILGILVLTVGVLYGCGPVVVRPVQLSVQPAAVAVEDDGAPPAEYVVEGAPVYYEAEPGVAFYPMFLDFPGSCFCIMPVRFYGGVWYAPGRVVVHSGHWAFHRPQPHHLHAWRSGGGHFRGHAPMRGHLERGPGGRMHAIPPPGIYTRPNAGRTAPAQHLQPQRQPQQRAPSGSAPVKKCPQDQKCS